MVYIHVNITTQIILLSLCNDFLSTEQDTMEPTFTNCPTQPINQASTGGNTLVTFTPPTGQDNCGTPTVACTATDPSNTAITLINNNNQLQGSFPVGTSPVTCTATDGATPTPLTADCNFNVVGMLKNG